MNPIAQDIRYALRQYRRTPGFTLVAALTLALGIAASTMMFGVMNAILLRPLPFLHPDRLVRIFSTQNGALAGPSPLDGRDFAAESRTFDKMVVCDSWRKNVSLGNGSAEPEQLEIGLVPAEYFEVLEVKPLMGRLFTENENRWGNHFEAILSYDFWQTRFGGDPAILGKTIRINDEPYTIIAVMPPGDLGPTWWLAGPHLRVELWTPFVPYLSGRETVWDESQRGERGWYAIGRLKPGVSITQAEADLQRIAANLAARYPLDRGVSVTLRPLHEDRVANLRPAILLLMGAVLLILLIACSNIANLLLARNSNRTREIAVRVAMGAKRSALIRQFMTENLMLSLLGGTTGCAVAWCGCLAIARLHPSKLPQLGEVKADVGVLLFGFVLALLSTLIFGTLPVWTGLKVSAVEAFKEGGRSNLTSHRQQWLRHCFVAGEMALAVMLLVATGLLLQSLARLEEQQPGFRVDHVLRTHMFLPPVRYPDAVSMTRFFDEYAARARRLPGVRDATISAACPPDDEWKQKFTLDSTDALRLPEMPSAEFNVTDSHYLRTLGIPLLRGRDFADSDRENTPRVALINQAFATQYFPGKDPVGKNIQLHLSSALQESATYSDRFTIIGVMGDIMNRGIVLPPEPQVTTLFRQTPEVNYGFKNLIVRTALDPTQLAGPIRRELHSLDPDLPFAEVSSMQDIMDRQTADRRYTTELLGLFAVIGMVLSGVGVYGVVSYLVAQRTSEIGLRMALGAGRADVLWMVLKQGLRMAGIGAAAGLLGAWMLRQAVSQLVFGISPADPETFLSAALLLLVFAAAASYLPARRAVKVDPITALRYE
jgi:putative ABC transport system permease protein